MLVLTKNPWISSKWGTLKFRFSLWTVCNSWESTHTLRLGQLLLFLNTRSSLFTHSEREHRWNNPHQSDPFSFPDILLPPPKVPFQLDAQDKSMANTKACVLTGGSPMPESIHSSFQNEEESEVSWSCRRSSINGISSRPEINWGCLKYALAKRLRQRSQQENQRRMLANMGPS